jgi:hypothetical protein
MEDENFTPALNGYIATSIDLFIPTDITQDLFRPPIA